MSLPSKMRGADIVREAWSPISVHPAVASRTVERSDANEPICIPESVDRTRNAAVALTPDGNKRYHVSRR
jgi:hypothetical protein